MKKNVTIAYSIFFFYSLFLNFQINLPIFQVVEYDYHWNSSRTASAILNLKYSFLNFDFPFFDYFKNFSHYTLFQVIPTLSPIYFLIFLFDVDFVLKSQLIIEPFIGMVGIYLIFRSTTKNIYLPLIFSIFYMSLGHNLSNIKFLIKDYYYLPLFIYYVISFFKKKNCFLLFYLVLLNFVSNWSSILLYPTISFFLYLILLDKKENNILKSFLFSILIFLSLSLVWLPLITEILDKGTGFYRQIFNPSLINFKVFDHSAGVFNNFFFLFKSGIDGFLHPYYGTIGPLYIPSYIYGLILYFYFIGAKKEKKIIILLFIFVLVFFCYFFIFSEFLKPQKIRQHLTLIPPIFVIIFFYSFIKIKKKLNLKILIPLAVIDFSIFIFVSFYEPFHFTYNQPNKIDFTFFIERKISILIPFLNFIFFFILFKFKNRFNFFPFFFLIFFSFVLLSAQNAWLNKFKARSIFVTNDYKIIYHELNNCIEKNFIQDGILLFNSHQKLNADFVLMTTLNKKNNIKILPEYEETNSKIFSIIHEVIARGIPLSSIEDHSEIIEKYEKTKQTNLSYFTIKSLNQDQIDLLSRIGINKIISTTELLINKNYLVNTCNVLDRNFFLYNFPTYSSILFLSNYRIDEKVSNKEFFSQDNYKKIDINNLKNNLNLNLSKDLKNFKYLYFLSQKKHGHKVFVDDEEIEFLDTKSIFDSFIILDLKQIKSSKDYININIKYDGNKILFFIIFLVSISLILIHSIYKWRK